MHPNSVAESGFGFLTRLAVKPTVLDIAPKLFPNGLLARETIELSGDTLSGKTHLITELIAKCVLPSTVGGLGTNVLFINTDHHFTISIFYHLMLEILKHDWDKSHEEADEIVKESLMRLNIINCYDNMQFRLVLQTLDLMLVTDDTVSLVVIDSVTSFYWLDRQFHGIIALEKYVQSILKTVQKHTFRAKVPLIYTKFCETSANTREVIHCRSEPTLEYVNYKISLHNSEKHFHCTVETPSEQEKIKYILCDNKIHWL